MAGSNIGNYYLSVSPSFKGFASAVNKELGGIGSDEGGKAGSSFKTGFLGKAVGLGAALWVSSGIAGFVSEAVAASDATDKFKSTLDFAGLDTSKIDDLTASTKKYADETVYDLGDIQNVTAQLASNSVKDYDKLAEAAGNLNAVAGGNAETFKSVGMVLTQTAGQGKLTTENWNQLADAIPGASGKLQEAMKANWSYTGNFRDAMERGEISADEFNQALMDLGMTDVAQEAATSTSTMEGAWGNFQATVVGGLKGLIDWLKPALTGAMSWASDTLGAFFEWIQTAVDGLTSFVVDGDFTSAFADAFGVSEDSGIVDFLFTVRDGIKGIYDLIVNGKFSSELRDAFGWEEDSGIVDFLLSARDAVIDFATSIPEKLGAAFDWVNANKDWLSSIAVGIGTVVVAWKAWTTAVTVWNNITKIATAVQTVFNAVMNANPIMLVVTAIGALVAGLIYFFTQTETGQKIWAEFTGWMAGAWDTVKATWDTVWSAITGFFTSTWDTMKSTAGAAADWIKTNTVDRFLALKDGAVEKLNAFKTGAANVWEGIKDNARTAADWVKTNTVDRFLALKDGAIDAFTKMKDGIGSAWGKLKEIAAAPVNFVITDVYTGGIKKFVEDVAGKLGLSIKLPTVNPIKLNRGGMLPGFGGGDRRLALLEDGEFVVNKYATRRHAPLLASINGGWGASPGTVGGRGLPGFSEGGIVGWFKDKAEGIGNFLSDPVGAVADLIVKPVRAIMGDLGDTVWGEILTGGVEKIFTGVTDWFKGKSSEVEVPAQDGSFTGALGAPIVIGGGTVRPIAGGRFTSGFGVSRYGSTHAGIDLAAPTGTPVRAYKAGQVAFAGWNALAGRTGQGIGLRHAGNLNSYYGHLSRILVSAGQMVAAGQHIGAVGSTGNSTGPHLHWELSNGSFQNPFNPAPYLNGAPQTGAGRGKTTKYDAGGWLPPGDTMVRNLTRKPEAVLTAEQWRIVERKTVTPDPIIGKKLILKVGEKEMVAVIDEQIEDASDRERKWR